MTFYANHAFTCAPSPLPQVPAENTGVDRHLANPLWSQGNQSTVGTDWDSEFPVGSSRRAALLAPTAGVQLLAADVALAAAATDGGELGLTGAPLQPCSQAGDRMTGWTRTGSCSWDPSDSGFHQVCVTMSSDFLKSSAKNDRNDLSSVVNVGGHWCICAWAWAAAVRRDPKNFEGLKLDCERTNGRLRDVYRSFMKDGVDLMSPSGKMYPAKEALNAAATVCG